MSDALSQQFHQLCNDWGRAIRDQDLAWFDAHFAHDLMVTAHPWQTLRLNREQMIELDRKIVQMDVEWVHVTAHRYGDVVLVHGIVHYDRERFEEGASFGENMPNGEQLSARVNGKAVLYSVAWREKGDVWQIFDHHMIAVLDRDWREGHADAT